eukprot:scaffold61382_cov67-Phaeocystis_antarctica.AAC.4
MVPLVFPLLRTIRDSGVLVQPFRAGCGHALPGVCPGQAFQGPVVDGVVMGPVVEVVVSSAWGGVDVAAAVIFLAVIVALLIKGLTEFLHRWCLSLCVHAQRQDLHQLVRGLLLRLRQNLLLPQSVVVLLAVLRRVVKPEGSIVTVVQLDVDAPNAQPPAANVAHPLQHVSDPNPQRRSEAA